jgi:hypothetical protein
MNIDLTTMKAIMENDKFALYIVNELTTKNKYKGVRLDKRNNSQVGVYIEKTNLPYPPYRVIGFTNER